MITASNLTTAEAGRNSRTSTNHFEEADIKEAEREDRVSELEISEEELTQAILDWTEDFLSVEQSNFSRQKLPKPLGQDGLFCLSQEGDQ